MNAWTSSLGGIHGQRMDYWSELAWLIVPGATDSHDMGCQRQLTVDDNTEICKHLKTFLFAVY